MIAFLTLSEALYPLSPSRGIWINSPYINIPYLMPTTIGLDRGNIFIQYLNREALEVYANFKYDPFSWNKKVLYRQWKRLGQPTKAFYMRFDVEGKNESEAEEIYNLIVNSIYVNSADYYIEQVKDIIPVRIKRFKSTDNVYYTVDSIIVLPSKYEGIKELTFAFLPEYDSFKSVDFLHKFVKMRLWQDYIPIYSSSEIYYEERESDYILEGEDYEIQYALIPEDWALYRDTLPLRVKTNRRDGWIAGENLRVARGVKLDDELLNQWVFSYYIDNIENSVPLRSQPFILSINDSFIFFRDSRESGLFFIENVERKGIAHYILHGRYGENFENRFRPGPKGRVELLFRFKKLKMVKGWGQQFLELERPSYRFWDYLKER